MQRIMKQAGQLAPMVGMALALGFTMVLPLAAQAADGTCPQDARAEAPKPSTTTNTAAATATPGTAATTQHPEGGTPRQGASTVTSTWQPATARGLDPLAQQPKPARPC